MQSSRVSLEMSPRSNMHSLFHALTTPEVPTLGPLNRKATVKEKRTENIAWLNV